MFWTVPLSIIRSFSLYTQQWYVIQVFWHIPYLCVQWKTTDDGQRNCLKHVDFYSKNKFEKSVHLVGFITRIYLDARSPEHKKKKFVDLSVICPKTPNDYLQMGMYVILWSANVEKGYLQMDMQAVVWIANTRSLCIAQKNDICTWSKIILMSMYLHLCLTWDDDTAHRVC